MPSRQSTLPKVCFFKALRLPQKTPNFRTYVKRTRFMAMLSSKMLFFMQISTVEIKLPSGSLKVNKRNLILNM
jgi:hypothetical protein